MTGDTKTISKLNSKISAMQGKINALQAELDKIKSTQTDCRMCAALNDYKSSVCITQIRTFGTEYRFLAEIMCCPKCGKALNTFVLKEDSDD